MNAAILRMLAFLVVLAGCLMTGGAFSAANPSLQLESLPQLAQLVYNKQTPNRHELLRTLARSGLYASETEFAVNEEAFAESNLKLLFSILSAEHLDEDLTYELLDSIDHRLRYPKGRWQPEDASRLEKNISYALQKYHRQLFERYIEEEHFRLAELLLQLVFKHRVPIFYAQKEAATEVQLPVVSPLLEYIVDQLYRTRLSIEHQLLRLQPLLSQSEKTGTSFQEFALKFLPRYLFTTQVRERLEQGKISLFSVTPASLKKELLRYINLGLMRNVFLNLSGTYYLKPLIEQDDLLSLKNALYYFSTRTERFREVLEFGGDRTLLHLDDGESNLILKAARLGNLTAVTDLYQIVRDRSFFLTKRSDTLLHIVVSAKEGNEEEMVRFLKGIFYSKRFIPEVIVGALRKQGTAHRTPLQWAALRGYEQVFKEMLTYLQQERAYDPLEHGGSSYELYQNLEEGLRKNARKRGIELAAEAGEESSSSSYAEAMKTCKPIEPYSRDNPQHSFLIASLEEKLQPLLSKEVKAYEDPVSSIYQPAFAFAYEFFLEKLPNFTISAPKLQLGYLGFPLRKIVEKVTYDCAGGVLDGTLLYSYICSSYEAKFSLRLREEIREFLNQASRKGCFSR